MSIINKPIVYALEEKQHLLVVHEGGLITSQNFIHDISICSSSSSMTSTDTSISHHKSMFFEQYDCKTTQE